MLRSTKTRTLIPALLAAGTAVLALVLPGAASAMGPMKASETTRSIRERICRPQTTCAPAFLMNVKAEVPLSRGEVISPDHRAVIVLLGDDAFSDDRLAAATVPLRPRPATAGRECTESGPSGRDDLANQFYRSGDTLFLRGCFYSAKKYGPFNEDTSFLDQEDELILKINVVDGRGKILRSATIKDWGYF